jgi:hypothetical protein
MNTHQHMLPDGKVVTRKSRHQYTHIVITNDSGSWGVIGWARSKENAEKRLEQRRRAWSLTSPDARVEPVNCGTRLVGHMNVLTGEIVRNRPEHS